MSVVTYPAIGTKEWYELVDRSSRRAVDRAKEQAFCQAEYIGQEGFAAASEILELARMAGIKRTSRVLDLASGAGATASFVVETLQCSVVPLDRANRFDRCGFNSPADLVTGDVRHLPFSSGFDVVLLLETMLTIQDKTRLVREVRRLLAPGGRFAFTMEEGAPLSRGERQLMPGGETIWLAELGPFLDLLESFDFRVRYLKDQTNSHARIAGQLAGAFETNRGEITAAVGDDLFEEMVGAHRAWARLLETRRVRKLAMVAEV